MELESEVTRKVRLVFAQAFQTEFKNLCAEWSIPQNEIIYEAVGPELQDTVYAQITNLIEDAKLEGGSIWTEIMEWASDAKNLKLAKDLLWWIFAISKEAYLDLISSRQGQKFICRILFNAVLVCACQVAVAVIGPWLLEYVPQGCNSQTGQPWKDVDIVGYKFSQIQNGSYHKEPPGPTSYVCAKSNHGLIQILYMCINFFTAQNPTAMTSITLAAKNNASLNAYVKTTTLQTVAALNVAQDTFKKLVVLDDDWEEYLLKLVNWLNASFELGTAQIKEEAITTMLLQIGMFAFLLWSEQEKNRRDRQLYDSFVVKKIFEYIARSSGRIVKEGATVVLQSHGMAVPGMPVVDLVSQVYFQKLKSTLILLDRNVNSVDAFFKKAPGLQGVPNEPFYLLGTSTNQLSASREPAVKELEFLFDAISQQPGSRPQQQRQKWKGALYWDILVAAYYATIEQKKYAPEEPSFFVQVEKLLHKNIPIQQELNQFPWQAIQKDNPHTPANFPPELKRLPRGPTVTEEEVPVAPTPTTAKRSRSNPRMPRITNA